VLRRISGPKRDEVTGQWRELHNVKFNVLYSSLNTIWVIKSRRTKWARYVARMRERFKQGLCGKPQGNNNLETPSIDERIILKWIFKK
jgi:hypothetical protein